MPSDRPFYRPEMQTLPREHIVALQLERLQRLITRIWERPIPMFRRKLESARLTPRDLAAVNAYERVDDGLYLRRIVPVRHRANIVPALAYILRRKGEGRPRPAYIDLVEVAARDRAAENLLEPPQPIADQLFVRSF